MTPDKDKSAASPAVFLERQSYRRRRLMDVARLVPILGAALFAVPLLWSRSEEAAGMADSGDVMPMSEAIVYVFAVWAALIGASALFGAGVRRWGGDDDAAASGEG